MNNDDADFNIDDFVKDAHLDGTRFGNTIKRTNPRLSTLLRLADNPVLLRRWGDKLAPLDEDSDNLVYQESFFDAIDRLKHNHLKNKSRHDGYNGFHDTNYHYDQHRYSPITHNNQSHRNNDQNEHKDVSFSRDEVLSQIVDKNTNIHNNTDITHYNSPNTLHSQHHPSMPRSQQENLENTNINTNSMHASITNDSNEHMTMPLISETHNNDQRQDHNHNHNHNIERENWFQHQSYDFCNQFNNNGIGNDQMSIFALNDCCPMLNITHNDLNNHSAMEQDNFVTQHQNNNYDTNNSDEVLNEGHITNIDHANSMTECEFNYNDTSTVNGSVYSRLVTHHNAESYPHGGKGYAMRDNLNFNDDQQDSSNQQRQRSDKEEMDIDEDEAEDNSHQNQDSDDENENEEEKQETEDRDDSIMSTTSTSTINDKYKVEKLRFVSCNPKKQKPCKYYKYLVESTYFKYQLEEYPERYVHRRERISNGVSEGYCVREKDDKESRILGLAYYDPHESYTDVMDVEILTEGDKYEDAIQYLLRQTMSEIFKCFKVGYIQCYVAKSDDSRGRMLQKLGFGVNEDKSWMYHYKVNKIELKAIRDNEEIMKEVNPKGTRKFTMKKYEYILPKDDLELNTSLFDGL